MNAVTYSLFRYLKFLFIGCFALAATLSMAIMPANAVDLSASAYINNQNYNQLITDSDFIDINSMSKDAIQAFLVSQGSDLATLDPSRLGASANGRSAAQIIYDAAHAADDASSGCYTGGGNNICMNASSGTVSPRVILVTLQKEASLITRPGPSQGLLDAAMGYGCPDSGGCNATYSGFANQVGWGAWQLRLNYEGSKVKSGIFSPYLAGSLLPNVTYNYDLGNNNWLSGSATVNQSNNATASLYRYTPHIFNGNYNFWRLGISWFGFGTTDVTTQSGTTADTPNDTTSFSVGSYSASFNASGTKNSAVTAVFNGQTIADVGATTWKTTIPTAIGVANYTISYINPDGSTAGAKTITVERRRIGDMNGDGKVDVLDLSLLANQWGQTVRGDNWYNLNPSADNVIDILDLSLMVNNWTN